MDKLLTCGTCKYNKKLDHEVGRCMRETFKFLFTKHAFLRCHYYEAGKYSIGLESEPEKVEARK